jgi:hypothetical protein
MEKINKMKWAFFAIAVIIISLAYSISVQSKINSEIIEIFGDEQETEVIILLKEDYDVLYEYGFSAAKWDNNERKKMMIGHQQEHVLDDLKLRKQIKKSKQRANISIVSIRLKEEYDFELTNIYSTVNGFAGNLKKSSYERLRNNPRVKKIYRPRKASVLLDNSIGIINATNTWRLLYNGTNITGLHETVCVIDTGVDYTHPALGNCSSEEFTNGTCSKVIGGYDYINDDNDPMDDHGHGTHVAGIAASTNDSIRGVSPDAKIIGIKVLDSSGSGSFSDIISGIDWCVNNASIFNISVITMSLGTSDLFANYCDTDDPTLTSSVANAIDLNISVIAAAGNAGDTDEISSPACITNITAVGATTKSDTMAYNRNNITDLLAPGVSIQSLKASVGCLAGCSCSGSFAACSGTSMATPHVAGAYALLRQYRTLEKNTIIAPAQIQHALNQSGKRINDSGGSGLIFSRINVYSALLSLDTLAPNFTFIHPTLKNSSNFTVNSSQSFIFINLSSSEILSAAILEIGNKTSLNHSMNINELNFYINISEIKVGVRTFRIYGNDSSGNLKISESRTLQVNNTAPNISSFSPSLSNAISEPNNQTFSVNFSDHENDAVTISWYVNNSLELSGINKSDYNFTGNSSSSGFYIINATLYDGAVYSSQSWNFSVNNSNFAPNVTSVNLTNTEKLNLTNGSLQPQWSSSDFDLDIISLNETLWYINGTLNSNFTNQTFINSHNTTKLENWTFSVRVFDGTNWGDFKNSSAIRILNAPPMINNSEFFITVLESQIVNISINATDLDEDALSYKVNKSGFLLSNQRDLIWTTSLSDAGYYALNVTVNDSSFISSLIVNVTILDARDLDNDGNPDFNDTDDDNDGIDDTSDYLFGNASSINTSMALSLIINGSGNLSKLFNGTFLINITNGTDPIIEFNFTFNSSNNLDLANITINRTTNGSSAVSIKGNINLINSTKTVYLEKVNTTAKSVCIKDSDVGYDNISSACDESNEILAICDNSSTGQYACYDTGYRYRITGLNHSAVKEQCRDNDGDGYGTGCTLGSDCDDSDFSKTITCSSQGSGSSGGGGSGGGSGGSGGGAFHVCNNEWRCSEWSACDGGSQLRECSFVKIPQFTQSELCEKDTDFPEIGKRCEIEKVSGQSTKDVDFLQANNSIDESSLKEPGIQITQPVKNQLKKKSFENVMDIFYEKSNTVGIIFIIALLTFILILINKHSKKCKAKSQNQKNIKLSDNVHHAGKEPSSNLKEQKNNLKHKLEEYNAAQTMLKTGIKEPHMFPKPISSISVNPLSKAKAQNQAETTLQPIAWEQRQNRRIILVPIEKAKRKNPKKRKRKNPKKRQSRKPKKYKSHK